MKLQDLDKTKRYDLSECTDEELMCVLNWLKENDVTFNSVSKLPKYSLMFDVSCMYWKYTVKIRNDIKPTFIHENKQEQFLKELQQLCKKYNTTITSDIHNYDNVIVRITTNDKVKEIISMNKININSEGIE